MDLSGAMMYSSVSFVYTLITLCDHPIEAVHDTTSHSDTQQEGKFVTFFFNYEHQIKREVKRIHIRGCRCNERLKAKTDGSTRLSYTVSETSSPNDQSKNCTSLICCHVNGIPMMETQLRKTDVTISDVMWEETIPQTESVCL